MKYRFEFTNRFKKQVKKLDRKTVQQIKLTVDKFIKNPDFCDWVKLQGDQNLYRIRSGDYRIIFEKQDLTKESIILILFIYVKHRKDVYRNL